MNSILKKMLMLWCCLVIQLALSSLIIPAIKYDSIEGIWVNYTEVKDANGKTIIKDGEKYYRKLSFLFEGIGTLGEQERLQRRFNMESADGEVMFIESFGNKNKYEYAETQEKEKDAYGGYDFDRDNLDLKIGLLKIELWDKNADDFVVYTKGNNSFSEAQKHIDGITILKLEGKSLKLKWDYNMNGKIDSDETMKFTFVEDQF